jgi:hypothetical protein
MMQIRKMCKQKEMFRKEKKRKLPKVTQALDFTNILN